MVNVKTTIEIPDELFRESKARAALRGESLKDFVCGALEARLQEWTGDEPAPGWRKVFGRAALQDVAELDAIVEQDLGNVDPTEW